MNPKNRIAEAVAVVAELTGTELSTAAMRVMVEDLAEYPTTDVLAALQRCRRECRHRLTLADALERLPNQPPGPDGAWAIAVAARPWDEDATLVLPRAIFESFPFALWPDRVAARMAFKDAYPEKLERYGDEVFVSLGHNAQGRETAILDAVRRGLVSREAAIEKLPHLSEDRLPPPPSGALAEAAV